MTVEVDATYENGILRLDKPLPLEANQRVRVTVQTTGSRVQQNYGLLGWKGDPAVVEEVALGPEFGIREAP
jgi:predicted DNA-binding antitoxin AbrB/MazE fold protein